MKICRFNGDHLGLVRDERVLDVSAALEVISPQRWPLTMGDPLIAHLPAVLDRVRVLAPKAQSFELGEVKLESPVANPGKIVCAPINYRAHIDETAADQAIAHGRDMRKNIWDWGLFLKANSSLIGVSAEICMRFPERRTDHELELVAVIGQRCSRVSRENALQCVVGYTIGLDMTARGPELQSFRKSVDTYTVCGPWMVTADELPDPSSLDLRLWVNGEPRQSASSARLIYDVPRLIEYASSFYTLHPGDLIFTGTPEGVGPVRPGDVIAAEIERIGRFDIKVSKRYHG